MRETWFKTLLLSFLSCCSCQADTCIVGVFGKSVSLPCLYNGPENLTSLNISLEWRRGAEVVYKAVWAEGHEKIINTDVKDRTTVSSLAQTGDFTMKLSNISLSDAQNYSLHLNILHHGDSALLCTVCLNVTADVKSSPEHKSFIWIHSIVLCMLVTVLVTTALCFQKKWNKQARRQRQDDSDCEDTEMMMMDGEHLDGLPNRDRCVILSPAVSH